MTVTAIILIAFVTLLAKALCETAWGLCMHLLALICENLSNGVAIIIKIGRYFQKEENQPAPQRANVVSAFIKYQGTAK